MDTFEYLKKNFELYTQEEYKKSNLSQSTKRILCEIGLPEEPIEAVQFNMRSTKKITVINGNVVIGNNEGTYICVNTQDEIIAIDPQSELPIRFINKNLNSFLDYIVIFLTFRDKALSASDEKEEMQVLEEMRKEFEKIDGKALCYEENWWAVILEQIEMGLM